MLSWIMVMMDKHALKKRKAHRRRRNMLARELRTNPLYRHKIHKALRSDRKQEQAEAKLRTKELREYELEGLEEQPRRNVSFEAE